jgi:hypothetical protein
MPDKIEVLSRLHLGSLELTEEIIRMRAYELFVQRGHEHGHDLEDWLQAESEVMGKKPSVSAHQMEALQSAAAVA